MTEALTLYLAADHGGFEMKNTLSQWLLNQGHKTHDLGTHTKESVDYPDIAQLMATSLYSDKNAFGILVCGSGIGISIAANRFSHIRAALVNEPISAALARQHNDANVLCLSGRLIGETMAKACVEAFMTSVFEEGRHQKRVDKLSLLPQ